ncbi:MAG: DUF2934 domain-containing protein [Acidobacteriaceae bacterium]|nr:DUF2934 domain-containing protein [Acidobacteriaceae bacterium]MBV9782175.1 DUF2934 domain-containing protein [Acidobacteriaceae bacterium]
MSAAIPVRRPIPSQPESRVNQTSPAQNTLPDQQQERSIHEQIAQLAYVLWERRGKFHGSPEQDWFEAEKQVLATAKH